MNELPLKRVFRPRVSDGILDSLVELLSSGTLKPGDKLPNEVALAKQQGVARSSLREAVRSLVVGGVLEASPGRGTIVAAPIGRKVSQQLAPKLTNAAVRDFYELRVFLEAEAAARAAKNWTPAQLEDIEAAHQSVNKLIRARKSWFAANARFHSAIARASGNSAFFFCIRSILSSFREPREMMDALPSTPKDDMEDHAAILAAIKERKSDKARVAMQAHLARTLVKLDELENDRNPRRRLR
jgi:GntR family transcriptional repressor for pyruvate dehydrogenase complex